MLRGGELEVGVWNVGCGHRGAVHTRWIARPRKRNAKEGNEMATTHRFARKNDPGGRLRNIDLLGASLAGWRCSAMEKLVRRAKSRLFGGWCDRGRRPRREERQDREKR